MQSSHKSLIWGVIAGVLASAVLEAGGILLRFWTGPETPVLMDPPPYSAWSYIAQTILGSIQSVAPGLLAGWLASRSGWKVGAVAGLLGQLAAWAAQALLLSVDILATFEAPWTFALLVANLITCAVGGVAGVALRTRSMPSNIPLQPTPYGRG